jgi:hypothetical protein
MALGSTELITEMIARNLPGSKGRQGLKADNLAAICEPIVYKVWEPRRFRTLWISTACYRDKFTFYLCPREPLDVVHVRLQSVLLSVILLLS